MDKHCLCIWRICSLTFFTFVAIFSLLFLWPKLYLNPEPDSQLLAKCVVFYITMCNLLFLLIYLGRVVYVDVSALRSNTSEVPRKIQNLHRRNGILLHGLVFPVGTLTAFMFWTIYFIDFELLAPRPILDVPPWHWQINVHFTYLIPLFIEVLYGNHDLPDYGVACRFINVFILLYCSGLCILHLWTGRWLYTFLEILSFNQRVLFFIFMHILSTLLFHLGYTLSAKRSREKTVTGKHND